MVYNHLDTMQYPSSSDRSTALCECEVESDFSISTDWVLMGFTATAAVVAVIELTVSVLEMVVAVFVVAMAAAVFVVGAVVTTELEEADDIV